MLYLSAAPNRLTNANYGGDGGDFLAAVMTGGIPHPSGYPTYVVLGRLFQSLPFGTPVFRGVLESLLPAAVGAGLLAGWIYYETGARSAISIAAGLIAGTAWGAAPLLFSQAVIVEVHGLQSLFIVLAIWWITLNLDFERGHTAKNILVLSFLVGLGFGNHLTIALLSPAMIFALICMTRRSGSNKLALGQVGLIAAGGLIYLYLPLRAGAFPAINWGNPQSWSGFLWEVSGNPYRGLLFSIQAADLWERIRSIASLLLAQYGAIGLVAGAIGVILFPLKTKWLRWVLVWIFFVYFAFAIGYKTEDSLYYLLPAVMAFAIWIGLAVPALWSVNWRRIPIGIFLVALLAVTVLIRIPGTRSKIDPRAIDQPARYAEQLLREAPLNAIIKTTTDEDSFPLWYYHFGLHQRPDLRVVVMPLTQFVWYQQTIVHIYPDLKYPAIYTQDLPNADWGNEIAQLNPNRPVCTTRLSAEADTGVTYQCSSP